MTDNETRWDPPVGEPAPERTNSRGAIVAALIGIVAVLGLVGAIWMIQRSDDPDSAEDETRAPRAAASASASICMAKVETAAVALEAYQVLNPGDEGIEEEQLVAAELIEPGFFNDGLVEIRNDHAWTAGACDEIDEADAIGSMLVACSDSFRTCGVDATFRDDVYSFRILPEAGSGAFFALEFWAADTECLSAVDIQRVGQTRALDGMVESADGRTTWTYHPDDGLYVVCDPRS